MTTEDLDSDPDEFTEFTEDFPIESGVENLDWDAGMYKPPTIGDYTWRDLNTDGLQDNSEPAMTNVIVRLRRFSDDVELAWTVTDGTGAYQFDDIREAKPDYYYIEFEIPATFLLTAQNTGDDDIDSDPDITTGFSPSFFAYSGIDTNYIDAGYYVEPPSDCPHGNTVEDCVDAPITCELAELNEFCTTMEPADQETHIPGCPPLFAFHNPSWFSFVAGSENVSLIIHAFNCISGGGDIGIQYGIYDDCDMSNPIELQCPCVEPGDIPVEMTGLTIGRTYHFFIDGCNGTQCSYWIEIIEGGGIPDIIGADNLSCDELFPDCNDICVGADVTFTLENIYNAITYVWTMNGVEDSTSVPDTTIHFSAPGSYTLCGYGKTIVGLVMKFVRHLMYIKRILKI